MLWDSTWDIVLVEGPRDLEVRFSSAMYFVFSPVSLFVSSGRAQHAFRPSLRVRSWPSVLSGHHSNRRELSLVSTAELLLCVIEASCAATNGTLLVQK